MKLGKTTSLILFGLIVIIGIVLLATQNSRKGVKIVVQQDAIQTQEFEGDELLAGTYTINTANSFIEWTAKKKIIANYVDKGFFRISDGEITIDENETLVTGDVAINVTSLEVTETGVGGGFSGLARDMLSGRFLDVEQFPTATFTVTSVELGRKNTFDVAGDLTIKSVTQPVELTMEVQPISINSIQLVGGLEIDRTEYDVTFGSDRFFDDLGDKVIDDMVQLGISLQATLQE